MSGDENHNPHSYNEKKGGMMEFKEKTSFH
jgi:hypothetical protein